MLAPGDHTQIKKQTMVLLCVCPSQCPTPQVTTTLTPSIAGWFAFLGTPYKGSHIECQKKNTIISFSVVFPVAELNTLDYGDNA